MSDSDVFLYYCPDKRSQNVHAVYGPIPKFFGYSSKEQFLMDSRSSGDRTGMFEYLVGEDSHLWSRPGLLKLQGDVFVRAVESTPTNGAGKPRFKLCPPAWLAITQTAFGQDVRVNPRMLETGDEEYMCSTHEALLVPERQIPTFRRLLQQRKALEADWSDLLELCWK